MKCEAETKRTGRSHEERGGFDMVLFAHHQYSSDRLAPSEDRAGKPASETDAPENAATHRRGLFEKKPERRRSIEGRSAEPCRVRDGNQRQNCSQETRFSGRALHVWRTRGGFVFGFAYSRSELANPL